jgi:hypothetical protein
MRGYLSLEIRVSATQAKKFSTQTLDSQKKQVYSQEKISIKTLPSKK